MAATPNSSSSSTPSIWKTPPPWTFTGGNSLPASKTCARRQVKGPSWARKDWPQPESGDLVSALDGNWPAAPAAKPAKGAARRSKGPRPLGRGRAQGHDGFRPCADDDPRLSHARPPRRRSRSPEAQGTRDPSGARPRLLRLHRSRHGPPHLPRQGAGPRTRHRPPDRRHPEAHLLRHAGRRVHAHLRPRAEGLDPGAHRGRRQVDQLHRRRQEGHPQQADRGRGLRAVPQCQIHRHQALRP